MPSRNSNTVEDIYVLPEGKEDHMERIITNKIRCKKCGDIIESKTRHDFRTCSCGAVAVDGGCDYLKRTGNYEDWEELSEVEQL
jgi:predicted phosphodiesterase